MADRIEVKSWSVPSGQSVGLFDHAFILYTQNEGTPSQKQYYISGTYSGLFSSLTRPWGNLIANTGEFNQSSFDYGKTYTYSVTIAYEPNGSLLSEYLEMKNNAEFIESIGPRYSLVYVNSNALINTVVKNAKLDNFQELRDVRILPGINVDLDSVFGFETTGTSPGDTIPTQEPIAFYRGFFGGGGGGFDLGGGLGGNGYGGASWGNFLGGTSGRWVLVGVGVGDGPIDYGYKWVEAVATRIRPIVLDLDNDGLELSSPENAPGFAFFGGGTEKTMGWFHGGDALLIHDANGNGLVDNGAEFAFLHHSPGAQSDLEALRTQDSNGNGWFDPGDSKYAEFKLWRDLDFDGVSDPGELSSLAALDVHSINLNGSARAYQINGNDVTAQTAFARVSGGQGSAYDVGLKAYSVGFQISREDTSWALASLDTDEVVAIMKGDWQAYIPNLRGFEVIGELVNGFQLGSGNDDVRTDAYGINRGLWISAGQGHDTINLSTSSHSNTLIGGDGNDSITGGTGDDIIAPGTGSNQISDGSGNDHYLIEKNSDTTIWDFGGVDGVSLGTYTLSQVQFSHGGGSIVIYALDGSMAVTLKNMWNDPSMGVEYVFFKDQTIDQARIFEFALQGGDARPLEPGLESSTLRLDQQFEIV